MTSDTQDSLSGSLAEEKNPRQAKHAREIHEGLQELEARHKGLKEAKIGKSGARPTAYITVTDEVDASAVADLAYLISLSLEDRELDRNFNGRQAKLSHIINPEDETVLKFKGGKLETR